MPQGKIKTKVQVPNLSKKKYNPRKKNKLIKKGARSIAPKKAKLIEAAKLQKTLTAAINKNIEKEVVLEAGKSNAGLKLLEAKQFEQKKHSNQSGFFLKTMNQAKRMKVEDDEELTSGSSSEDELQVLDDSEVLNVEFEGLSLLDEDLDGIRQLLLQLFSENEKTIDSAEFAKALILQNIVGTVLKQVQAEDESEPDDDIYALVTVYSLTRPKSELTEALRKFFSDKCVSGGSSMVDKKKFAKIFTELTQNKPSNQGALGLIISERFINVPPQAVKPMYEKLLEEIKEAASKEHAARFNFDHYIMISKICSGFQSVDSLGSSDDFYVNAEEELFANEATAKFDYTIPGNVEVAKRRVLLIPKDGFFKCVERLKDEL